MHVDHASFLKAIDSIQDAALDIGLWQSTIQSIGEASGALGVNIMEPKGGNAMGGVLYTDSLNAVMEEYMRDERYLNDFRSQFRPMIRRNGVTLESAFASQELFDTLDYYKFMAKHRMRHTAMIDFTSGDDELYFVLQRDIDLGGFHPDDMKYFHLLRQKLKSAALIMRGASANRILGMSAGFEQAKIACLFFDERGLVTLANSKAEALFGNDFNLSRGAVRCWSPRDTSRFYEALKGVLSGNEALSSGVVCVPRIGKRPLVVRFERVGDRAREMFPHSRAMALIEDLDDIKPQPPETLIVIFGLTQTEARIAILVAQGLGAVEIAAQCEIAYETVRGHIRSIFRKTETGRQAELSALFGRIRL